MTNRNFGLLMLGLVVIAGIAIAAFSRGWVGNDGVLARKPVETTAVAETTEKREVKPRTLSEALGIPDDEIVEVGGIARPRRDFNTDINSVPENKQPRRNPLPTAGRLPALKGNENSQVSRLFADLQDSDERKEAASAAFLPQEFDRDRYFANPEDYLKKVRPGRSFKPANPGPGVTPIAAASNRFTTLLQNESANLKVKTGQAQSPVTFYAVDGGEFDNRLKSITVAANDEGIAEVKYKAVAGTASVMDIVPASPLNCYGPNCRRIFDRIVTVEILGSFAGFDRIVVNSGELFRALI